MSDALIKALRRIATVSYGATIDEARSVSKVQRDAADLIEQQARDLTALREDIESQIRIASEEATRAANWKRMLQAVTSEIDDREYSKPWRDTENAPGHGHEITGIWDWDNGKKAGKPCAWCLVWNEARAALANKEG